MGNFREYMIPLKDLAYLIAMRRDSKGEDMLFLFNNDIDTFNHGEFLVPRSIKKY